MRRTVLLPVLALTLAGCVAGTVVTTSTTRLSTPTSVSSTTIPTPPGFPVTVEDARGPVTIEREPVSIVSLSTTGTEMLFAVGAGDQVVAVDEFSTYPDEAPVRDLSGFTPNVEAILSYEPDLVVISFDPGDLQAALDAVGIPSLLLMTAASLDDSYDQLAILGSATGHVLEAEGVVAAMRDEIADIVANTSVPDGISFYHEVDETYYSASSSSYLGQIYALLGMENIADDADLDGSGFPQLSAEYIVSQDPDLIFLADVDYGVTVESLTDRPGWAGMKAVENDAIIGLDSYLASNWGPRVVEFLRIVADAVIESTAAD